MQELMSLHLWFIFSLEDKDNVEEDKPDVHQEEEDDLIETNVEDNDNIRSQLEEDEELAIAIQESLILESPPSPAPAPAPAPAVDPPPPIYSSGNSFRPDPFFLSSGYRYILALKSTLLDVWGASTLLLNNWILIK